MISFKEFQNIINERVGDFGNPPLKTKIKCGWAGTTSYFIKGKRKKVCKFHRKR